MTDDSKRSRYLLPLALLAGIAALVCSTLFVFPPDRPVATLAPGSSSGPAFVVQIIRPRTGLPLGGILPPQLFGQQAHLGFDSASPGAFIGDVGTERMEFGADGWDLVLAVDAEGHVRSETEVVFELMFQERLRRVRCKPGLPAVAKRSITVLDESAEISGTFDIELAHCEDAATGKPLGWPPQPLILHGSFDRLLLDGGAETSVGRLPPKHRDLDGNNGLEISAGRS